MKKLLLHTCCAPCLSGTLSQLVEYDVTVFFCNSNIDSLDEYNIRLTSVKKYVEEYNKENQKQIKVVADEYNHNDFLKSIDGMENQKEGGERCTVWFALRLALTAKYAKADNHDIFATTLTISPHKNFDIINTIGNRASTNYDIPYLASNFKKNNGYLHSIQNSQKYNLYRQTYCGCNLG